MGTARSRNIRGGGQARYASIPDEAQLVRQVFHWVGRDRLTIREAPPLAPGWGGDPDGKDGLGPQYSLRGGVKKPGI